MVRDPDNFLVDGVISSYVQEIGAFPFLFTAYLSENLAKEYI